MNKFVSEVDGIPYTKMNRSDGRRSKFTEDEDDEGERKRVKTNTRHADIDEIMSDFEEDGRYSDLVDMKILKRVLNK